MQTCNKPGHAGEKVCFGTMCVLCREEADAELKREFTRQRILSGDFMEIPRRFKNASLGDFENVYNYMPLESVLIFGGCGVGKTHLSVAMAKRAFINSQKELPKKGFYNFTDVSNKVKSSFHDEADLSMEAIIAEICKVPFCILDDIGITGTKGAAFEALYVIVNRRYENLLPTIYTTNLDLQGLQEAYGDRIASRLSSCTRINLDGEDRRLKR
jgi:DNA replication protein DnaC